MDLFIIFIAIILVTPLFILSLLLPFTFRKRKIEKIQFLDLDRSTKALGAWDFFYSILKMENVAKAFHYTEILFSDRWLIYFDWYICSESWRSKITGS